MSRRLFEWRETIPSDFREDIGLLDEISEDTARTIGDAVARFAPDFGGKDEEMWGLARELSLDVTKLARLFRLTWFLTSRGEERSIPNEGLVGELLSMQLVKEPGAALRALLQAAREKAGEKILKDRERINLLSMGAPQLLGFAAAVDKRGVFEEGLDPRKEVNEQPVEAICPKRWEPIVLLEIVAELNEVKTNFTCQISPDRLNELIRYLQGVSRRLEEGEREPGKGGG